MIMVRFLTQSRNDAKSLMAPEEHPSLAQGGSPENRDPQTCAPDGYSYFLTSFRKFIGWLRETGVLQIGNAESQRPQSSF